MLVRVENQTIIGKKMNHGIYAISIGSGLGGPGAMIMLTRDGKEYFIGQEGFEGDWLNPAKTFPFIADAFNSEKSEWFRISKEHASEKSF